MWRIGAFLVVLVGVVIFGFSLIDASGNGNIRSTTILVAPDTDITGFKRAIAPWDWNFPTDHGAHEDFQTEWWYYTGNLATEDDRRFGFQFTIFRRAITPEKFTSESEWNTNQVYFAHFTVSDIENGTFYHDERFSRGSAGLAGAEADPAYRTWIEDWQVQALNEDATQVRITAESDDYALDVTLHQTKPPALQGQNGLSPKSEEIGNASYYYSLTRNETSGTITIQDESYTVSGNSWMDHEFSTSALDENALGWDWFGLIFDNNYELMVGQIRQVDAEQAGSFGGLLIFPDGTTEYLDANSFTITASDEWISPQTGATYPSGWEIDVQAENESFNIIVTPLMQDQELASANITYWEGAVKVSGDTTGFGYAELTGYTDSMQGRF